MLSNIGGTIDSFSKVNPIKKEQPLVALFFINTHHNKCQ